MYELKKNEVDNGIIVNTKQRKNSSWQMAEKYIFTRHLLTNYTLN